MGRRLRQKINPDKLSGIDKTLGAVVQALVVFVVAWLIATSLTAVSGAPWLAKAINNSVVLLTRHDNRRTPAAATTSGARGLLTRHDSGHHDKREPAPQAPQPKISPAAESAAGPADTRSPDPT